MVTIKAKQITVFISALLVIGTLHLLAVADESQAVADKGQIADEGQPGDDVKIADKDQMGVRLSDPTEGDPIEGDPAEGADTLPDSAEAVLPATGEVGSSSKEAKDRKLVPKAHKKVIKSKPKKTGHRRHKRGGRGHDGVQKRPSVFQYTLMGPTGRVFNWQNDWQVSAKWAYAFLDHEDKNQYAPHPLDQKINKSFKKSALLDTHLQYDIFRFPYILLFGVRVGAGLARNYDVKGDYFVPLSAGGVVQLKVFKKQFIVPFLEVGMSAWNINFSQDFSTMFPYWGGGIFISLALFKSALFYTFPNEYGFKDLGFTLEVKRHIGSFEQEDRQAFLTTFHAGIYCRW